jgi:hypothetical protein
MALTKAQIGRCGEMLVQYTLLRHGVESAALMTDTGIDLVAYLPGRKRAMTIQVKANLKPKPGGGRGAMALDWWVRKDSPAEMVALVDLETENVWFLPHKKLEKIAQQKNTDRLHFYFYVDEKRRSRSKHNAGYTHLLISQQMKGLLAQSG